MGGGRTSQGILLTAGLLFVLYLYDTGRLQAVVAALRVTPSVSPVATTPVANATGDGQGKPALPPTTGG